MTVGELRKLLADIPDDTPIVVDCDRMSSQQVANFAEVQSMPWDGQDESIPYWRTDKYPKKSVLVIGYDPP